MSNPTLKRGYREKEAATYISMSPSFLRQSRMNGHRETRTPGPHWVKIGRAILLGHGDIKMTLRYAHLAPEHKAAAVERLVSSRS